MSREDPDHAHLWDMWRAACDIAAFVTDLSFAEFAEDRRTRYTVERQLLVIGEAAGRVSEGLRNHCGGAPRGSARFRNAAAARRRSLCLATSRPDIASPELPTGHPLRTNREWQAALISVLHERTVEHGI